MTVPDFPRRTLNLYQVHILVHLHAVMFHSHLLLFYYKTEVECTLRYVSLVCAAV